MTRKRKIKTIAGEAPQIPFLQLTPEEMMFFKRHEACQGIDGHETISNDTSDNWIGPVKYFTEFAIKKIEIHFENQSYFERLNELKKDLMPYSTIVSEHKNLIGICTSPTEEFKRASRSFTINPYENLYFTFDENPLVSRSALKLCNIDAVTDFSLRDGEGKIFVDLCGAPGGFTQYLLYRNYMKGYGMSLQGQGEDSIGLTWNESAIKSSRFVMYQGKDDTGDIYNWNNVLGLQSKIQEDLGDNKVNLVVADGGVDAQRNVCSQEDIAHKLVVSQVAAALLLLKPGGIFIVKLFGFLTLGSKALIHSLIRLFDDFCILKPITSRPASAERYAFFKNFYGLPTDFDLFLWRNEMIQTKVLIDSSYLNDFLDQNDHDMLLLNMAACKRIVNVLHHEEDRMINSKRFRKSKSRDLMHLSKYYMQKWQIKNDV